MRRRNGAAANPPDIQDCWVWFAFVVGWSPNKEPTPVTPWRTWREYLDDFMKVRDELQAEMGLRSLYADRVLRRFGPDGPGPGEGSTGWAPMD